MGFVWLIWFFFINFVGIVDLFYKVKIVEIELFLVLEIMFYGIIEIIF